MHLADLASGAALDRLWEILGTTAAETSNFFVRLGLYIVCGLLLSSLLVSLLFLRNHWAMLVAFSLPFSMPLHACMRFWMIAVPVGANNAVLIGEYAVVPTIVAACMLFIGAFSRRRMQWSEFKATAPSCDYPRWRKLFPTAALVAYLLLCAYGWYAMASTRAEWIEAWKYWDAVKPD
ncbi:MAG: hypothetical protein KDA37_03145 [Planctomycetales bacterium]|nr:hypothetical protein [Planctomycetales bacterium]